MASGICCRPIKPKTLRRAFRRPATESRLCFGSGNEGFPVRVDKVETPGRYFPTAKPKRRRCTSGIWKPKPVAPYDKDNKKAAALCFDREIGNPVPIDRLKSYAEALAQYHLHPETKFLNGDYLDRGLTQRRHVRAIGIRLIGKEANHWEEQFFLGLSENAQIDYGQDPNSAELFREELRRTAFIHHMRRISEVSGIARNTLSLIARGQIVVTPVIIEKLIRAMTTLDEVASDQAEFEQTIRDGLLAEIEQRGLRNVAKSLGIDASNLGKMIAGERKLTPGKLVK
jgi:hypothetical protein